MTNPAKVNYALAIDSAVVYVALALDKAAGVALSVEELAKDYKHPVPSDLTRIKMHEGMTEDGEAIEWMIRRALAYLGDGVEHIDGLVIIRNGYRFEDLRLHGKKLHRPGPDIHEKLRDPFNPMTGIFSKNTREHLTEAGKDPAWEELRESLATFGWVPEFPALVDERGVVLVGSRRLALAKELGIQPVKQVLHIGIGDAADARRLKIAIASNIGGKKLSPNDRKRIAAYLYQDNNWSQESIGKALDISQPQVSLDLKELLVTNNSKRPKVGRPRKHNPQEVDTRLKPLFDAGMSRTKVAVESGLPERAVRDAQERYHVRQEVQQAPIVAGEVDIHFCTCPVCGHRHQKH